MRVHPASPVLISWPLDDGAFRLDITVWSYIGSATFIRKGEPEIMSNTGYTGTAKTLHWLILALLLVQFIVAWTMPDIKRDTKPDTLIDLHLSIGIIVLAVAVVRLAWRAAHGEPAPLDGVPSWQVQSARVIHWLLYVLLFVIPVLGWINASWRGFPVILFGVEFPKLVGTRVPGWGWTGDLHSILAEYVLLALVGLHVAAALYHYFIRRDGVMQRMWPGG